MQRRLRLVVALVLMPPMTLILAQAAPLPQENDKVVQRIAKLIDQLGGDSFVDREEARKELETIGVAALPQLRKAVQKGNLETSRRAADLIRHIEQNGQTAALLAPTKVRLKLEEVPVLEAVARLAKLSNCVIRVDGDRTLLIGKKVTLNTGEVSFWEALDALCGKAGLVEKLTIASVLGDPNMVNEVFAPPPPGAIPDARKAARAMIPPLRILRLPDRPPEAEKKTLPNVPKNVPPLQAIPGSVILIPGAVAQQNVSYAGAARVVLKHGKADAKQPAKPARVYDLVLEASAEPRLLGFAVTGVPTIARAIDEHGQVLSFVIDPPAPARKPTNAELEALRDWLDIGMMPGRVPAARGVTVRVQLGEKPSRRLRELTGSLPAVVLIPDSIVATIDNALQSKGKVVDVKGGGQLLVDVMEKLSDVDYRIVIRLENLPGGPGNVANVVGFRGGKPVVSGGIPGLGEVTLGLLDAKGNRLTPSAGPSFNQEPDPNDPTGVTVKHIVEVRFRRDPEQGPPARLVLAGTHTATLTVPFRFANVSLP
jgi:hypothetical protein